MILKMPILAVLNQCQVQESPFEQAITEDRNVYLDDGNCFKVYSLASFITNQREQLDFYNEYVVTRRAEEK